MNRFIFLIIILAVIVKAGLIHANRDLAEWNRDENAAYAVASNYLNGFGFTAFDPQTDSYEKTSYHAPFPVFTYAFLQQANVSKQSWAIFIHSLSMFLYAASIFYFYRIARMFLSNDPICLIAALLYSFYPSIIYYVGSLFLYENIGMPLMVILMYKLLKYLRDNRVRWYDMAVIPATVAISCLYRSQLIFIFFVIFAVFSAVIIIDGLKERQRIANRLYLLVITAVIIILVHVPVFKHNHDLFGNYILSTQTGFELLQGHNPFARGSWNGNWDEPGNELYIYARDRIPRLDGLDEYEESLARGKLAVEWALNNPWAELKLIAKKMAIYFLPQNYDILPGNRFYNPVNLAVHLLFLASLALTLTGFRSFGMKKEDILILSPVIASILLSLIFYAGYRWRYYAEPFMALYILLFLRKLRGVLPQGK